MFGSVSLRLEVPRERVLERDVVLVARAADRLGGVVADIDEKEIEPAVAVVVEEHGAGGMAGVVHARGRRDVAEAPAPVVLEQHVAGTNGRDIQIRVAVVVDIGERRRNADLAIDLYAGRRGDVLESAAAKVPGELVAADLVDEVHVEPPIAVDVGDRHAGAVVVVRRLVRFAGIVDDPVTERDTAAREPVGELEVVKGREARHAFGLLGAPTIEPGRIAQFVGNRAERRLSGLRGAWRSALLRERDRRRPHQRGGERERHAADKKSREWLAPCVAWRL